MVKKKKATRGRNTTLDSFSKPKPKPKRQAKPRRPSM